MRIRLKQQHVILLLIGLALLLLLFDGAHLRLMRLTATDDIGRRRARSFAEESKPHILLIFKYSRTGSTWLATMLGAMHSAQSYAMPLAAELRMRSDEARIVASDAQKGNASNVHQFRVWHEVQKCCMGEKPLFLKLMEEHIGNRYEHLLRRNDGSCRYKDWCCVDSDLSSEAVVHAADGERTRASLRTPLVVMTIGAPNVNGNEATSLSEAEWRRLFRLAGDGGAHIHFAALVRQNTVKRAVSTLVDDEQKRKCGGPNVFADQAGCLADLKQVVKVHVDELRGEIWESREAMKRTIEFTAYITDLYNEMAGATERPLVISYEALQADPSAALARIAAHAGVAMRPPRTSDLAPMKETAAIRDAASTVDVSFANQTLKRVPDDLSEFVRNWNEVEELLRPYPCLSAELHSTEPGETAALRVLCDVDDEWMPDDCGMYDYRLEAKEWICSTGRGRTKS